MLFPFLLCRSSKPHHEAGHEQLYPLSKSHHSLGLLYPYTQENLKDEMTIHFATTATEVVARGAGRSKNGKFSSAQQAW